MKYHIGCLVVIGMFFLINSAGAGPIDCNEHGSPGRRVCEERERVIEHQEEFSEKVITYELEKIEAATEAAPSPVAATAGSGDRQERRAGNGRPVANRGSRRESGRFLSCVSREDYNRISRMIRNGRSGTTGNPYFDTLVGRGSLRRGSEGIWVGDRLAPVCPEGSGERAAGHAEGALAAARGSGGNLQDLFATPAETDTFRLVPVESTRAWTETWYETVIEQFCWWVPDDAIIDPVTMEPLSSAEGTSGPDDGSGDPTPEPATMLLFGSIMAFLPAVRKRYRK